MCNGSWWRRDRSTRERERRTQCRGKKWEGHKTSDRGRELGKRPSPKTAPSCQRTFLGGFSIAGTSDRRILASGVKKPEVPPSTKCRTVRGRLGAEVGTTEEPRSPPNPSK